MDTRGGHRCLEQVPACSLDGNFGQGLTDGYHAFNNLTPAGFTVRVNGLSIQRKLAHAMSFPNSAHSRNAFA